MSKPSTLRRGSPALAALAVLLTAGAAQAADPVRYTAEHKLRLHIDTDLFSWRQTRPFYPADERPDPDPRIRVNDIGFGAARPLLLDRGGLSGLFDFDDTFGLFSTGPMFSLGLGYGVHKHVLIGARLGLSFDRVRSRSDAEDMSPDAGYSALRFFNASFTPYIEILPIAEGRVLPYILFRGGFSGGAFGVRTRSDAGGIDTLDRVSGISPHVGIGAGAHFFVIPRFSFDLGLHFDYRWSFTKDYSKDIASGATDTNPWERSSQAFQLGLNLGLSVWFL